MANYITTLKDEPKTNNLLPRTVLKAVADDNGDYLDNELVADDINALKDGAFAALKIHRIIKSFGSVTMSSNGYLQVTPPTTPTGYSFIVCVPWNFGASTGKHSWGCNGSGSYIYGEANDTISNCSCAYFYMPSDHFTSENV